LHVGYWLVALIGVALALGLSVGGARSANSAAGLIAYTCQDGVYVMNPDGSGVRAVWPHRWSTEVAWSPDGTRLAFGTETGTMVANADGSGRLRIASLSAKSLTWSPNGRRIAFTAHASGGGGGLNFEIWVVNANGSNLRRLTRTPRLWEGNVDWSPVGGRLAFDSGGFASSVYVMNADGSNLRNLTPERSAVDSMEPDWSPDGRRIAFTHAPWHVLRPGVFTTGKPDIWVMNASGKGRVRLTENNVYDGGPTWSPDGQQIAFLRHAKAVFLPEADPGFDVVMSEIYVMNADGSGVKRLTHNDIGEWSIAWQPIAAL
jgi:Tol biopolymer transport system component